jgi:3-hydroxybutyryl-CoA dehydrogenase
MESVLLVGEGKLAHSVATCLVLAGHEVTLVTRQPGEAQAAVQAHLSESHRALTASERQGTLTCCSDGSSLGLFDLIVLITRDRAEDKRSTIASVRDNLSPGGLLAINLQGVNLEELQQDVDVADRMLGLNWVEPAHTSFFLEIIANERTSQSAIDRLLSRSNAWGKDPYVLRGGFSVQARLNAALTREALHLVSNGYATHEDIDRNCRNDAGYYLPFAGNARYMDLMGTYAYGVVMKDLNQHLSKDTQLDRATMELASNGSLGMEDGKGFFDYSADEAEAWKDKMTSFSYQIRQLIKKYPFENRSK